MNSSSNLNSIMPESEGLNDSVDNVSIENTDSQATYERWICYYPDSTKLAGLFLFGAHDTGTFGISNPVYKKAKCQNLNFQDQLKWGVRVFDCRLSENMNFFHGIIYCHVNFARFASDCISFLQNNPKEFVVATIKAENAEGPGHVYNTNFQKIVDNLGRNNFFFSKNILNEPVSNIRGKIVIVTRYYSKGELGYIEEAPQINWPDDTTQNPTSESNGCLSVAISDRYTAHPETKVKVVREVFPEIYPTIEKYPTRWFQFFTSGYDYPGAFGPDPEGYMRRFRSLGEGVMGHHLNFLKKGGTLLMDYVDYWNNFRDIAFKTLVPTQKTPEE